MYLVFQILLCIDILIASTSEYTPTKYILCQKNTLTRFSVQYSKRDNLSNHLSEEIFIPKSD